MSTLLEKLIGSAALKDNFLKCLRIKLKPGSVTTDKIADKAVTSAKLSDSVKTDLIQNPINAVQENLGNHVSDTTKHITAQERSTWNSKQDALTFDNLPTQGSNNPVKSNGIYNRMHILTTAIQQVSEDVVTLQQAMPGKQNVLTFDNTPTANSNNPVKSGGIKSAIDEHTENSAIHVTAQDKQNINLVQMIYSDIDPDTSDFRIFNTTSNPPMIFAKFSVVLTPNAGGAYYTQESSYGTPPHYLLLSGVEKHQGAPGNGTLWQVVIDMQGKRYYRSINLNDNPINWNTYFLPQNN